MAVGSAVLMVITATGWGQATAQTGTPDESSEGTLEVCVAARHLEDGRLELALQQRPAGGGCGERLLPRRRALPADATIGRWLVTSAVGLAGLDLRIAARRLANGRVEVALQRRSADDGSWKARLLPRLRFVPAAGTGRWLSSSPVYALATPRASYLRDAQVLSFYGHPGAPALGVLGFEEPAEIADDIAAWAAAYDRLNGTREVIGAFHVITGVSQSHPTPDGTWLGRLSDEGIAEYVEVAGEHGMLVFLDTQIGWSDPLTEVKLLERFLREPFVHVALDPEFATRRQGIRPGLVIGSVTAQEVNEVQRYLAALVQAEGLPPKILMVHQFTPYMVRDRAAIEDFDAVDLSIDMDGFGLIPPKVAQYNALAVPAPSEWPAFKLFFDYDTPLMTPEQVLELDPPPDLIIYQ